MHCSFINFFGSTLIGNIDFMGSGYKIFILQEPVGVNVLCIHNFPMYVFQMVANYYPGSDQVVETGMKAALKDILQKGVLQ